MHTEVLQCTASLERSLRFAVLWFSLRLLQHVLIRSSQCQSSEGLWLHQVRPCIDSGRELHCPQSAHPPQTAALPMCRTLLINKTKTPPKHTSMLMLYAFPHSRCIYTVNQDNNTMRSNPFIMNSTASLDHQLGIVPVSLCYYHKAYFFNGLPRKVAYTVEQDHYLSHTGTSYSEYQICSCISREPLIQSVYVKLIFSHVHTVDKGRGDLLFCDARTSNFGGV